MEAQALSNFIHSLANSGQYNENLIQEILTLADSKLRDYTPQALANTIWALATLNYKDEVFIKHLLKEAESKLRDFDPQGLANTIWAMATLNYKDEVLINHLLKEAESKLKNFKPQELVNTIWAIATLNCKDEAFIKLLLKEAEPKFRDFKPQQLANTAWSLAVLDHSDAPSFLERFLPLACGMADKMVDANKVQCFQYLLLMEDEGHVAADIKPYPQYVKFRRLCEEAAKEQRATDIKSRTQLEIFEAVRCLPGCSDATSEHLTEDGLFSIEIALQLSRGQKLAIEADGPSHFLCDGKTLNGSSVLRNLLLEYRGWKVISISDMTDWVPLRGREGQVLGGNAQQRVHILDWREIELSHPYLSHFLI